MPLQRDQRNEASLQPAAPTATTNHLRLPLREAQSDKLSKSFSIHGMEKSSKRVNVKIHASSTGGKHQLDDVGAAAVQSAPHIFKPAKMPIPDTMRMQKAANTQPAQSAQPDRLYTSEKRREEPQKSAVRAINKVPKAQKTDAFDDTESLDRSMFESVAEDEKTVLLRPQRAYQYSEQEDVYGNSFEDNHAMGPQDTQNTQSPAATGPYPGWEHDVEEERRYQAERHIHTPQAKYIREYGIQAGRIPQNPRAPMLEDRQDPGTPTRTQSAPPEHDMITRKNVNFAASHQIMNPSSPSIVSSEMTREDGLEQPISRPSSAQAQVQNTLVHARPQQLLHQPQNQTRQNVWPAHAARFQPVPHHVQSSRQENPKVSAPESDNQDLSEDELARLPQHSDNRQRQPVAIQQGALPARKRSYDDMSNILDYSETDLKGKKLPDLQAEPFPQDPRDTPQAPPTDNAGNEMSLNRILENLSKISGDAQRETFRTLTDEQWASTGQWFVDKFQTDLEKLMAIRLERRKVAMSYEDKIRRRQRVVEQYEAQVEKELQELQAGGKQLVDGRKVPTGSRSGTPMKVAR